MKVVTIKENDAGQRLDKFLIKFFKAMPQSLVYKSLRKKRIRVNGRHESEKYMLRLGDVLELYINDEFFEPANEKNAFLKINSPLVTVVYEDENILLADKPQGIVVHSDDKEEVNTLISHIQSYLYKKGEYQPQNEQTFAPALCNRIDRNTRGIVVAAKNAESLRILNEKIKTKEIRKFYKCLATGIFKNKCDTLSAYLIKNENENKVYIYDNPVKGSKGIITKYKVLKERDSLSMLEVELITGRTHQIRAHLAYIGHPLLGDGKYGTLGKNPVLTHQALCSYKLIFDFQNDAGILNYLKGREFSLKNITFDDLLK